MAATYTASATFQAINKISGPMQQMSNSTASFASRTKAAFARVEMASRKLQRTFSKLIGTVGKLGLGFGALMIAQQIATATIELDSSLQSLQAITGVTGDEFKSFAVELDNVSKRQLIFAADAAKAFELVGSAKPELLESADALGKVTEAALILGKAGKLEVTDAVTSLTVSMNQFGAGANRAAEFVDILATAQQKGSGTISFLSEAMVNAGGTSKAFGNTFEDTVAILEGFAKAGVPASEAGNQLAGILSKLSTVQNREFNPQFTKATDIIDNLKKANLSYTDLIKLTDVRGAKWLTTIINQNAIVQELTGNLNEVGNAQKQANIQMFSFEDILNQISAAFKNAVTSTDSENKQLLQLKSALKFVADNMDKIISITIKLIGVFVAFKAIMVASKIAMVGYNVILGISAALQGASAFAVHGNTVAYSAYRAAIVIATAAQWAFAAALNIGLWPLTLIALAVAALIALIVVIVKKWDTWGAAVSLFLGPLGMVISLIQSFRRNWDMVKDSFAQGGIISGIISIGKVILDAILMPVQQLLELLGKIPGLDIANTGAANIAGFRENLFNQERALGGGETINTTATTTAQESLKREERITTNRSTLDINDNTGGNFGFELGGFTNNINLSPTN